MADDDLLDIKQAAALLQVSETSLRRWTNAGVLPSFRIGGRRERRFRRADLLAFLQSQRQVPAGHYCGFYSSDEGRTRQAVRFLQEGVSAGSTVFLAAASTVRHELMQHLGSGPAGETAKVSGRVVPVEFERQVSGQTAAWRKRFENAAGDAARTLHAFGDVSGFEGAMAFPDVLDFERSVDVLYHEPGMPRTALCLYDARKLSGEQVVELLRVHPDMMKGPSEMLLGTPR
jgi:excisionase family DNA binding protein